jgi:hypothetical protein
LGFLFISLAKCLAYFLKEMEQIYMGEERAHRLALFLLFKDALGLANRLEDKYSYWLGKTLYKVTDGIEKHVKAKAPAIFTRYLRECGTGEEYFDEEFYPGDDAPGESTPEQELSVFLGRMEAIYNGADKYQREGLLTLLTSMHGVAKDLLKAHKEGPYYEEDLGRGEAKKWIKKEMEDLDILFTFYLEECYPEDGSDSDSDSD